MEGWNVRVNRTSDTRSCDDINFIKCIFYLYMCVCVCTRIIIDIIDQVDDSCTIPETNTHVDVNNEINASSDDLERIGHRLHGRTSRSKRMPLTSDLLIVGAENFKILAIS